MPEKLKEFLESLDLKDANEILTWCVENDEVEWPMARCLCARLNLLEDIEKAQGKLPL